jgi:hypothetical protein
LNEQDFASHFADSYSRFSMGNARWFVHKRKTTLKGNVETAANLGVLDSLSMHADS